MRQEYGKVLVIAPSGYGKSYLSKTADLDTTGFINVERKPLPYKGSFKFHGKPKTWNAFIKNLSDYIANPDVKQIIIDSQSMAFDSLHAEMKEMFKGFEVYGNYNKNLTKYFNLIRDAEKDIIVLSHDETLVEQGFKMRKAKVHGKEFEGRVESYYTIVLFGDKKLKDGKPQYFLRTFEEGTSTKVPEGMFDDKLEIGNDAGYIFKELVEYYN